MIPRKHEPCALFVDGDFGVRSCRNAPGRTSTPIGVSASARGVVSRCAVHDGHDWACRPPRRQTWRYRRCARKCQHRACPGTGEPTMRKRVIIWAHPPDVLLGVSVGDTEGVAGCCPVWLASCSCSCVSCARSAPILAWISVAVCAETRRGEASKRKPALANAIFLTMVMDELINALSIPPSQSGVFGQWGQEIRGLT